MPAEVADSATAIQDDSRGAQGLRRKVSQPAPNTSTASAIPPPICHFHSGTLLMGSPGGYFGARRTESKRPQ